MSSGHGQDVKQQHTITAVLLGKGAAGNVYEGSFGNAPAAIKKILREKDYDNRESIPWIRGLDHVNIIRYYGSWEDDNFIYVAVELCAGTLKDFIDNEYKGPSPGTMVEMMYQVTLGLQYLHLQNILHRDLKSTNVLISKPNDGELPIMKLADFGFCKETQDGSSNSLSYSGVGTEGWRAPECYRSDSSMEKPTYTNLSDIFSLGCVYGYAFSGGFHPFGNNRHLRPANIIVGSLVMANLEKITDEKLRNLIIEMISNDAKHRPQLHEILAHSTFCKLSKESK